MVVAGFGLYKLIEHLRYMKMNFTVLSFLIVLFSCVDKQKNYEQLLIKSLESNNDLIRTFMLRSTHGVDVYWSDFKSTREVADKYYFRIIEKFEDIDTLILHPEAESKSKIYIDTLANILHSYDSVYLGNEKLNKYPEKYFNQIDHVFNSSFSDTLKVMLLKNILYNASYHFSEIIARSFSICSFSIQESDSPLVLNMVNVNGKRMLDIDVSRLSVKAMDPIVAFQNKLNVKCIDTKTGKAIQLYGKQHLYNVARINLENIPKSEYKLIGRLHVNDLDTSWILPIDYEFKVE